MTRTLVNRMARARSRVRSSHAASRPATARPTPCLPGHGTSVANVCRAKKLTKIRAASADKNIILKPPRELTLEIALEFIEEDDWSK